MVTLRHAARPRWGLPISAMAAPASGACPSARTGAASDAQPIQLENVVRRAYQRPFPLDLLEATQQELPEAARVLDLADDRFDDPFARGIDGGAGLRLQLASHPVHDRRGLRQRTARTGAGPLAMFLFSRRDIG